MTRAGRGVALGLALLALGAQGGCAAHRSYMMRQASSAVGTVAAAPRALLAPAPASAPASAAAASAPLPMPPIEVVPPRFGDAHPIEWPGLPPTSYPVHGIDISRWQGEVDWAVARAGGVNFAFLKATEGADWVDPAFGRHWQEAGFDGLPRGAYHFYYFCRSAAEQAAWYIAQVPREAGALPPVLDVEWNSESETCDHRPTPAEVRAEMTVFLNLVGEHYDQRPIVYSTVDFWHDNELWQLRNVTPWLRAVTRHPSEAYPGVDWAFWQYSGTGIVPGIEGPVDLNAFDGSEAEWAAWLAAHLHDGPG